MSSKNSFILAFCKGQAFAKPFSVTGIIIVGIDHFVMRINTELPKQSFCHSYYAMTFVL